ncbi:IclR family transcriptional regulator [Deinococcus radiotolerans]|uniref:IclR family transcriptional regulator n=1 Tax=Deinococcus radiotolerans TaxID=1309407 RepID=UPI001669D3B1|nr:helix-turn-helix domain-containing protein [Deinococcus radiotolerans]
MNTAIQSAERGAHGTDVPTLERPLYLLTFFTPRQPEWTLAKLARASGLPKASCLRALRVLEKYELLRRDGDGYRLGSGFIAMKAHVQVHAPPLNVALAHMEHLREQTGLAVAWAVLDGQDTLYTEVLPTPGGPLSPGERRDVLSDASGRLLLAFGTLSLRERLLGQAGAGRATLDTLDQVTRRAWLSPPRREDVASGWPQVAAPVFRAGGTLVAALSVSWPDWPEWPLTAEALRALSDTARRVSHDMGYLRPWAGDAAFFLDVATKLPD